MTQEQLDETTSLQAYETEATEIQPFHYNQFHPFYEAFPDYYAKIDPWRDLDLRKTVAQLGTYKGQLDLVICRKEDRLSRPIKIYGPPLSVTNYFGPPNGTFGCQPGSTPYKYQAEICTDPKKAVYWLSMNDDKWIDNYDEASHFFEWPKQLQLWFAEKLLLMNPEDRIADANTFIDIAKKAETKNKYNLLIALKDQNEAIRDRLHQLGHAKHHTFENLNEKEQEEVMEIVKQRIIAERLTGIAHEFGADENHSKGTQQITFRVNREKITSEIKNGVKVERIGEKKLDVTTLKNGEHFPAEMCPQFKRGDVLAPIFTISAGWRFKTKWGWTNRLEGFIICQLNNKEHHSTSSMLKRVYRKYTQDAGAPLLLAADSEPFDGSIIIEEYNEDEQVKKQKLLPVVDLPPLQQIDPDDEDAQKRHYQGQQ